MKTRLYAWLFKSYGIIDFRYLPRRIWCDALEDYRAWRFWSSPIWCKTYRCPACAGSKRILNSYDVRDCEMCHGAGHLPKYSGYHVPYWLIRLMRRIKKGA